MQNCLIALDGLAERDLSALFLHLPLSRGLFESLSAIPLTFSSSTTQGSWAEILTEKNLFTNGCAGYAHPSSSLNKLSVFTEADLLAPATFVETEDRLTSVAINVPLLLPKVANRVWLSDGSLPTNRLFSPPELRAEPDFKKYIPRPYKSHAGATSLSQPELLERCIEVESNRLSCAVFLFKQRNWSKFLYRLSIFDYLFHLVGMRYLAASDLFLFGAFKKFLASFDSALQMFSADSALKLAFVSCYSHVPCKSTLNLNHVLAQAGFLNVVQESASQEEQTDRMKVAQAMWQPSSHYLTTMEGRLQTSSTLAASPVSGCVYINRSSLFDDGIVSDLDYENVRSQVSNYLHNFLTRHYGSAFSMEVHPAALNTTIAPDLIVKIEGVEFHNLSQSCVPVTPLTTHNAKGFALLPRQIERDNIRSTELASLLNA